MRTTIAAAFLLAGLGACSKAKKAPPPPPPPALDAAVVSVDAAVATADAGPGPLTSAPSARGIQINDLAYGGINQPGLPAIKGDGSEVVATAIADDGGRGYLDLELVVVDGATSKVKTRMRLVDPNETSDAEQTDEQAGNEVATTAVVTKVRERVAKANALVATGTWRTLAGAKRANDAGMPEDRETLTVGDLTFTYGIADDTLTITRGGAKVASHRLAKLAPDLAPPKKPRAADDPCPGDVGYLAGVYPDLPSRLIVLEIGMLAQGHNCGGGGQVYVIVPMP